MSGNVVEKVVNNELDMTAGLISGVKKFCSNKRRRYFSGDYYLHHRVHDMLLAAWGCPPTACTE